MAGQSAKDSKARFALRDSFPVFTDDMNMSCPNASHSMSNNLLEVTDFFSDGFREKVKGLKEITGSFELYLNDIDYNSNKTTKEQALINYMFYRGSKKGYLELYTDDYIRLGMEVEIESFDISISVDGVMTGTVNFTNNSSQVLLLYEVQRTNYDLQDIENYVLMDLTNYEIEYVRDVLPNP